VSAFVFSSAYAGFATLALAMDRHQAQVWRQRPAGRAKLLLLVAGALGVVLSIGSCVADLDWSVGLVSWFGVAMMSSLALALALTYVPRRVALSTGLAWLLAGAVSVVGW
jgi:Protein of unknown function (DUF3325)